LELEDRRRTVKKKLKSFLRNEKVKSFLRSEKGLTIVEYAVAAGLITAAVALTFENLGAAVDGVIKAIIAFL
jgi:pilus assembly protein Flp/PilA